MAYTTLPTYVTNQLVTAAHANTYWRDNLNELFPYAAIGDIAYADATTTLAALEIGTSDFELVSTGTAPSWRSPKKIVIWRVVPFSVALSAGDAQDYWTVPEELNGYNLVEAHMAVDTTSTSGGLSVQIHNATNSVDMLSTPITIDQDECNSYTAAAQPVVDTSHDDVATGDRLRPDFDDVGTGSEGATIIMRFEKPSA